MRLKITDEEARELRISDKNRDFVDSIFFWDAYQQLTASKTTPTEQPTEQPARRSAAPDWSPSRQADINRANGAYDGVLG